MLVADALNNYLPIPTEGCASKQVMWQTMNVMTSKSDYFIITVLFHTTVLKSAKSDNERFMCQILKLKPLLCWQWSGCWLNALFAYSLWYCVMIPKYYSILNTTCYHRFWLILIASIIWTLWHTLSSCFEWIKFSLGSDYSVLQLPKNVWNCNWPIIRRAKGLA